MQIPQVTMIADLVIFDSNLQCAYSLSVKSYYRIKIYEKNHFDCTVQ